MDAKTSVKTNKRPTRPDNVEYGRVNTMNSNIKDGREYE